MNVVATRVATKFGEAKEKARPAPAFGSRLPNLPKSLASVPEFRGRSARVPTGRFVLPKTPGSGSPVASQTLSGAFIPFILDRRNIKCRRELIIRRRGKGRSRFGLL